ncbi:cell envelope integrity protein TolA [Paenibacillus sediminis]|uniref:Gas vesicle protein n=1 Tax=Paenibacillus sediminis TaxID=664909 RepID=A0ABS4H458_9BACL|nr:cell envelope integrity protein TolA [Paenibacillus sediminis]MBP1937320.1 gas vesicle protein [Paenibacillus sediminis]
MSNENWSELYDEWRAQDNKDRLQQQAKQYYRPVKESKEDVEIRKSKLQEEIAEANRRIEEKKRLEAELENKRKAELIAKEEEQRRAEEFKSLENAEGALKVAGILALLLIVLLLTNHDIGAFLTIILFIVAVYFTIRNWDARFSIFLINILRDCFLGFIQI